MVQPSSIIPNVERALTRGEDDAVTALLLVAAHAPCLRKRAGRDLRCRAQQAARMHPLRAARTHKCARAFEQRAESACVRAGSENLREQLAQLMNEGNRLLLRRPILMHRHPAVLVGTG